MKKASTKTVQTTPESPTGLDEIRADLTAFYQDLHRHPELSFAEHRTAEHVVQRLQAIGLDEITTGIGVTGVAGVLRNGDGPTVLLRADMDALPVAEQTGLDYASTATAVGQDDIEVPVMHACGHDMHVAFLVGALALLARARDSWSGTILAVFQPAEENGGGADAMIKDGLYERFGRPDVVLGQHVAPFPAGLLGPHPGPAMAATDALQVTLYGKGAHGSRPEAAVDPVVLAAATVMRLQTVVSREIPATETAVVTVGSLQAGSTDNVIPDEAVLKLNIRTYTEEVRAKVLTAIERIVKAEAAAAGAPRVPEIISLHAFPAVTNDPKASERTATALREQFGADNVIDPGAATASEDVGILATAGDAPLCYWLVGCIDPETYAEAQHTGSVDKDIPSNHSPFFAPVLQPTIDNGVTAMVTAARAWLDLVR